MKNFSSLREALAYCVNCPACGENLDNKKIDNFLGKEIIDLKSIFPNIPNNIVLYIASFHGNKIRVLPDYNHYCLIDLDGDFELHKSINSDYPTNSLWGFRNTFTLINSCKKCFYYENSIFFRLNFTSKKVEEVSLTYERVHYFINKDPIVDYCIIQSYDEGTTEIKYKLGESIGGFYKTLKLDIFDLELSNPDKLSNKISKILLLS